VNGEGSEGFVEADVVLETETTRRSLFFAIFNIVCNIIFDY
jgi:hypothetical protein